MTNTDPIKALAAVEAEKAYYAKPSSEAADAASRARNKVKGAATPECILQYRDEVLDEAAKWHDDLAARLETESEQYSKSHPQTFSMIMVNMHKSSAEAIRSLKSKEPSP